MRVRCLGEDERVLTWHGRQWGATQDPNAPDARPETREAEMRGPCVLIEIVNARVEGKLVESLGLNEMFVNRGTTAFRWRSRGDGSVDGPPLTRTGFEDDEDAASEPEIVEPSAMREPTTTTTTPDATSEVIRVETRAEGEYELRQTTTPKRFAVADGELLNVATAAAPIALRWTSGLMCHGYEAKVVDGEVGEGEYAVWSGSGKAVRETSDVAKFPRPEKPLKMYQFQGCPFCKKVREAVISLDLDVIYYPCPRDGPEYREFVRAEGGRAQFPYLVDDNTGTKMYESDDIIAYMYEKYGPGKANIGPALTSGMLTSVTAGLALLPRLGKGSAYAPSKKPENMQPIVFYGYEGSPFCVLVAEKLCELELPYLQRSCGRGSPKRQELFDKRGTFQVPYIEDPNTGIAMFESKDIVNYLQEQYAA